MIESDNLSQTLPCSFAGISFPVSTFHESTQHQSTAHKKADRDGAWIELTGLMPRTFQVAIPLYNGLIAGSSETWTKLFPETYSDLSAAFQSRKRAYFVHPLLGSLYCKATQWDFLLEASARNGGMMNVTFLETIEDDNQELPTASKFGLAIQAAQDLQASITLPVDLPDWDSLEDTLRSIQSFFDGADLLGASLVGQVTQAQAALDRLGNSIATFGSTTAGQTAGEGGENVGPTLSIMARIQEALNEAQNALDNGFSSRVTSLLVVRVPTSWGALASQTKNTVQELTQLNPGLAGSLVIPAQTLVSIHAYS